MADCTVNDVFTDVRTFLGDTAATVYTDERLLPGLGVAIREIYDCLDRWRLPYAERTAYVVLPANTNQLTPAQAGIVDMGEPIALAERGSVTQTAITGLTNATPIVITAVAHGLGSGAFVQIGEVPEPISVNGEWNATVVDADHFSLNGSTASGAYTSGGYVMSSSVDFAKMDPADDLPPAQVASDRLRWWRWKQDRFWFNPANNARQIRIVYTASGPATPASGSIGIDNCRSFLAWRTASVAAMTRAEASVVQDMKFEAFGPSLQADGTGGALRSLLLPMLLEKQKRPKRSGPFRPRRNQITRGIWY